MATDAEIRDEKRLNALNSALNSNSVGGKTQYLSEESVNAISDLITKRGAELYYDYVNNVMPEKVKEIQAGRADNPIRPYTLVEYGTDTGNLSLQLSLKRENTPEALQLTSKNARPSSIVVRNEIELRANNNKLDQIYKVIVGKTPSILSVLSKTNDLWKKMIAGTSVTAAESQLFDHKGKFYVMGGDECKEPEPLLPQGAFHVFINPYKLTAAYKKKIMSHLFKSNVRLLSVYVKLGDNLRNLEFFPAAYDCKPYKLSKYARKFPPIPVTFHESRGKVEKDECDIKIRKPKQCSSKAQEEAMTLYTFDLKDTKNRYAQRMACEHRSGLCKEERRNGLRPLNVQWIVNHKLKPIEYSVDDAYLYEYLVGLEIQGRQSRIREGELKYRKAYGKSCRDVDSDDDQEIDDCFDSNIASDDEEGMDVDEKELSDDELVELEEDFDEIDIVAQPSSATTKPLSLQDAILAIKNQRSKPSKACQKYNGNIYVRTMKEKI